MRAILTYHSVDRSGSPISVTPESFRSHVEWLAASGVPVVALPDLLALPDGAHAVALTFDDALASIATEAAPLLAAHRFPATVFVVSQHVGRDNRWGRVADPNIPVERVLDWHELARLGEQGFSIGAHTRRHPDLTRCGSAELADELAGSAEEISSALGARPTAFAYPFGRFNRNVAQAAADSFAIACTTEFRLITATTPPAEVPRLDAWYFRDGNGLSRWGTRRLHASIAIRDVLRRARRVLR